MRDLVSSINFKNEREGKNQGEKTYSCKWGSSLSLACLARSCARRLDLLSSSLSRSQSPLPPRPTARCRWWEVSRFSSRISWKKGRPGVSIRGNVDSIYYIYFFTFHYASFCDGCRSLCRMEFVLWRSYRRVTHENTIIALLIYILCYI